MISRRSLALGLAGAALSKAALAEAAADVDAATRQRADAALAPVVQEWLTQSPHTPGVAVAVQFANGCVWNRGFGLADVTTRRPMPANEYMRVGSVTKTFTGTGLAQLASLKALESLTVAGSFAFNDDEIGRASCRERV